MFAGWLTRVKVLAASSQCTAAGPGLESATVRSFAVFTIEARDAEGNRKGTGGDTFHVQIRLVSGGEAVRARVDLAAGAREAQGAEQPDRVLRGARPDAPSWRTPFPLLSLARL